MQSTIELLADAIAKMSEKGHEHDIQLLDLSSNVIVQVIALTNITTTLLDRIEFLERRLDALLALYMAQHAFPPSDPKDSN